MQFLRFRRKKKVNVEKKGATVKKYEIWKSTPTVKISGEVGLSKWTHKSCRIHKVVRIKKVNNEPNSLALDNGRYG